MAPRTGAFLFRWQDADMGIPESGARWRSNRACRGNGAVKRPDPAPSCLLGLVWHQTIDQTQRSLGPKLTPAQKIPFKNAVLCRRGIASARGHRTTERDV